LIDEDGLFNCKKRKMFYLVVLFLASSNAFTNYPIKKYAISIPYYFNQKKIPNNELLPPYEIPEWVYKRVFKKNKPNKYNT